MSESDVLISKSLASGDTPTSIADLLAIKNRAQRAFSQKRELMLEPYPRKKAPTFTSNDIISLCNLSRDQFKYLTRKGELPAGQQQENKRAKEYSLADAIAWVRATSKRPTRPEQVRGRIIAVANFKGGVAKTSTAVALGQALSLIGRRVLVIDCDPQGSATQLCGYAPDAEIEEQHTILPLIYRDFATLDYAIKETYWQNLDLVPASTMLFDAEFEIPKQIAENLEKRVHFKWWDILRAGLEPVTANYDVVIIDTPPSLSYITLNALVSADAILMPCPPEGLDFASSTQFWDLAAETLSGVPGFEESKQYDFVNILLTKARNTDLSRKVREWLTDAYGERLLPFVIPESSVQATVAAGLCTVYDTTKADWNSTTYARIREPLDQLAEFVNTHLERAWKRGSAQ
ncbi:ParA family protein [Cupriavidus numazuensis]|uniref:Iron-sulfur cluster carrier protein n=1 Tax=Cupriavidus numazuensis TaxID=221992 RepID=A0ABN7Q363_9BURK|nr:AAA family ATPase [Cupriavidus numazuensis]CAG2155368.1 Iron-sulfur cluster carrier protein [Cupriavidus numazuensis]